MQLETCSRSPVFRRRVTNCLQMSVLHRKTDSPGSVICLHSPRKGATAQKPGLRQKVPRLSPHTKNRFPQLFQKGQLTAESDPLTCTVAAQMAELVDAQVSGTCAARRGGSSPLLGTIPILITTRIKDLTPPLTF